MTRAGVAPLKRDSRRRMPLVAPPRRRKTARLSAPDVRAGCPRRTASP
eukprot:IDg19169t1